MKSAGFHVVLLLVVAAASLLTLAGATLTSRGPFGHGHSSARPLPSWPESNTLVARQNQSTDARASLTVRFRPDTSTAVQHRLLTRFGAVETSSVGKLGLHVIAVDPSKAQALLDALRSSQTVSTATPDDVRQVAGDTSRNAIAGQWALGKIGAPAAQRSTKSKRTVTIAVLDTGVDATHPALAGHVVAGYSALAGSKASTDPNGHGTWMTSIALAADPAARVIPVQVLNADGLGKDSDIIKGLVWAADHHANVIAMSFAGDGYSPALQQAIDYAWAKGSVVVAATGNTGSSKPTYPAGDAKVVGVSATDSHDRLWSGSNFGSDVTLAAPGVDVVAASVGGGTTTITGTSASAALVAGSAAFLLGADAKATNATVVGRLARNASQAGTVAQTGNGRLNLLQALLDPRTTPVVTAGVRGRQAGGPFVGPYGVAGASTAPTVVGTGICPNTTGTACTATANTLVVTLSANVPLNSTLFIVAGLNVSNAGNFSATDSLATHNIYTQDQHMNNTGQSVSLLRSPITQPLASGQTITITYPASSAVLKEATIFYVNGLITTSPMDSTAGTGSANNAAAAASTGSTTSGNVLVVGGVATATVGAGSNSCTALTAAGTAATSQEEPVYKTTTSTGILTCGATVTSGRWSAVTAAYKVDVTNPTAALTFPAAAAVYNAAGWAAITGSGTDESGGSGIDTTAGKTQLSIHDDTSNQYWSGAAWGAVAGAETYINPGTGPTAVLPNTAATWSYTLANTNLSNTHAYTVHTKTIDLAGNTSTVATATATYDSAAPNTATLTTNSSYNAAGWSGHVDGTTTDSGTGSHGISAVNVSIADSVSGKCWNGTDFVTATCPSWNAVSSGGTATGATNASWQYNLASSALADGHTYTVSVQATDATTTGTTSGTLAAGTFKYDTTSPAFGTLSYVLSGNCNANLFASGSTIYYNPSAAVCANAFNSRAVVTDATSGPASVNFPAIGTGSFAHANETISGASPYTSALNYGWSSTAATFSSTSTLTATDVAGNTSTTNITITKDATAPGGGVISVPATVKTLSVPITTTLATDGGSGLAAGTNVTARSNGQAVVANACPGSGYSGATTVTSPDTGVVSGQCYVYTLTATDNVGNTATWTSSPVLVDTVAPSDAFTLNSVTGGVYKSGATIYYKGNAAGSFKLRDTVTDALSGPASATFGLLSGLTGASHSSETISSPAGGPYDSTAISWATASGTGSLAAHGTDTATNSQSDTTFTLTLDNGVPTGGSISVASYATSASVTITSGNYTDGGSGIASNVLTRSNGQSPIGGVCPAVGTFTGSTVVTSPDTGVVNGQCYVYSLTGTDNVGNNASLATTNAVLIDATAPSDALSLTAVSGGVFKSGATIYYRGNAAGSFKLRDTVTDAVSGPASATFGALSGGTGFSTHNSETISGSSPYDSSAISWTTGSGAPTIPAHATDAAGNSSSDTTLTLSVDNAAPTGGSISVPAYATSTSVTISSGNYADGGSGLTGGSNTITRSNGQAPVTGVCPGSGYTGATTVASPDTGVSNGQCYVYTLTATDNVGNTATVSSSPVLVDTVAPADAFTLTAVSGGVYKSGATIYYKGNAAGSFKLRDTVTDAVSGPASTTFGALSGLTGASHSGETISGSSPYDSTAINWASASGTGSLAAHGSDAAGNSATDTTFTLTLDNGAPTGGSISVPAYATSTSVAITSGNYSDGSSGLAAGSNTITRSNGQTPVAGVCAGSGYAGSTTVSSPDTTVADGQCYVYTLTATDNVGNTATVSSSPVLVDTTAPAYASSALDAAGTHVDLTFTESVSGLDSGSTTPASAFTVTGATVTGVSYTNATHIRLTLSSRLYGDATPTVAYNPGGLTAGQKVKDGAGNLLGSVSAQSISMSAVPSLTQSILSASPGSITANGSSTSTVTVQLKNAVGANLATGGGTVTLAVGAGSLGSVTNVGDGTYTATLTSSTVAQDVTVTGQLDGSGLTSSVPVTYAPGAAAKLGFGVQPPASTTAGLTLSPSLTVRVLDANDNLVTSSSASVTVALGSNPGSSTLSGTKTRTASGGVATFDDLSLNKAATGYTLAATSGALTAATSASYDVASAAAATIAVNAGDAQSATVDTNVATAPSVLVTDTYGNPVQGSSVIFVVGSGGGSLTGGSATTDASGIATVGSWKIGTTAGANTLTASSTGLTGSPITFSATGTAAAAANIAVNGGNGQSATVDTNVATAPSALVTDTYGNPVSGTAVTFAVGSGGGSVTSGSATTNAGGVATVGSWKLGTVMGQNTLTATSGSLAGSPVTFTATGVAGTAGSMAVNVGQGQSATVNTNVATAPSVLVTDTHGNPVSGVAVTFAIGSGGGSLTGGSATTNASGFATIGSWELGTGAGLNQLTASSTGLTSVTFNATGTAAAAATIALNAGDNQNATVNTNVSAPSVLVSDSYGNPVSGTSVTFAVASGAGSGTGLSSTTNASGIATVGSWTLGTTAGANTLTATSGSLTGSPVTFNATGTADVLDHLVLSPASSSVSADVGSESYTAEGRDQYGNSLGDATGSTTFTITGGSCTGPACTVTAAGAHTVTGTLLGATGYATLTITAGAAANIALQAGAGQSATVNTDVATAPAVLVTDAYGNPVAGTSVTFAVASGGGSVAASNTATNASGIATVGGWTLGTTAGANSVTATAAGLAGSPVTFNATGIAGAAASIAVNGGNGQSATVNTNVATAPSVKVTDGFGNAVSGIAVTFAAATGGGSATGTGATTNASGVATVGSWTLGTTAGADTLTATSGSLTGSPVTFTATGVHDAAATVAVNGGNNQSATVGTNVATAPSVKVTDSFGNAVSGVSVNFAVASGGGSAGGTSATTNAGGIATVGSWTLGTTAGANTLTATSGSLTGSPITFTATGTAGAATTIALNAGDAQTANVDSNVSTVPSVVVTDTYGNPVSGVAVTFAAASGGGSVTGGAPNTNASGIAAVGSWKLGTTTGANTLTATSGSLTGSPVTFTATATAAAAAAIAVNGGNNQSATAGTSVAAPPSVKVTDSFGNAVPGVSVTFAIGSGGGSAAGGSATTNASGIASVGSWTLGTTAGAKTLTATSGSLTGSPVTFNATSTSDVAATIAINGGNNQNATVDTNVGTAPSAKVADQYGNPVAGVAVTFAAASGGGSVTGETQTTSASGVATLGSWKVGQTAGANTLSATASVGSVTFSATGTAGAASSIAVATGDSQVAIVHTNVTAAPAAFVTDSFGNPVAGVAVTFVVASGAGSASAPNATTDASGVAAVGSWTLGTAAGANTLTATAGVGSVTFNATGVNDAATTIAINGGDSQAATVNTNVATAPSVLVTDQYGNPVSGVSVTFAVASGGGSGTGLPQTTGADGVAQVGSWKLGTAAGANTLTATSAGLGGSPLTFSATGTAAAATTIAVNGGNGQSAAVGTNVSTAPSVKVTDTYGNAVSGVAVTFAAATGGGSATGTGATTNASGVATVGSWTLGTTAGANTLTATSGSLTGGPVTFTATGVAGTAGSMTINGGDGQSATVNTTLATAPSVLVTDAHANPVSGVAVTFTVSSGGGSVTSGSATTNASGIATVGSWKLGTGDGANQLTASASGLTSVTFNATGIADAAVSIALNGGDNQTATVDTTVSTAPSVRIADQYGNPVAGISVTFAIGSGGGSVTGANATSGVNGVATVGSWKLGTAAGAKTLTASSTGLTGSPITFNATAVAGSAGSMAISDGEGQSATVNTTVATDPSVLVTDANGNPVSGVSVRFAVATGGGAVSGANQITGADGIARVGSWQLGTTSGAGGNTLSVTSTGLPSVTFHATGLAAAAANLDPGAGDSQSATVNTNVAVAPSVSVTDAYGNPVSGISVTFAVASGGGSGTGLARITNASGIAAVGSWKLGTTAGANTMTAASSGLTIVTFTATGTPGAATTLAVNAGDNQSATVDTNVSTAPSVKTTDQYGNGVPGVSVTFAVASGGGSATGTTVATNGSGHATVGSWKLGTAAGANSLTASSTGLTGSPVTLNATGTAGAASALAAVSGDGQSATVNTNVSTAPSVRVLDSFGNPVAGVAVTFAAASGGGSVTGANAITAVNGVASVGSWKLGTTAGANTLTANSTGLSGSPVTFTATGTADSAASIAVDGGDNQSATVNTNVSTAPSVKVTDQYGNALAGVAVTFAVASGGGTAAGLSQNTNASGVATVGSWKLGTVSGANTLTAASTGLTTATFNATGTVDAPASMGINLGDSQSATVNTNVATAPSVLVADQFGNPIPSVSVTFAVASGSGSATSTSATTNTSGVATVGSWKLGTTVGDNTLTADSGSLSAVTFHATGTVDAPASLTLSGGNNQSATVNSNVPTAPSVHLADQYGNSVSGASVTFAVASGGGSATSTSATTNASGNAAVGSWKLGTAAGANTLTADSSSLATVTFHATGTVDAPASLTLNAGNSQSATVNTNVATAPSGRVTDQYGNPVSGVSVTFAVATGGGSATSTSATTNASGVATVGSWKLGTAVGANTLTAASSGLTTVTFNATGTVDTPASLAANGGDNQSATVNNNVATAPSARVTDQYGNPVSGVSVTFAVATGGGSATSTSATTNASGVATVGSWKLGTGAGANTLTADATGLTTLTFNATGVAGAPASATVNGGEGQSAVVDTTVATTPSVLVTDQYGNPVQGVGVTFAVASGGGSATGTGATTNASGVATVGSWKLGQTAGANTLTAATTGLTTITFHASGTNDAATALSVNGGDNQTATVDNTVSGAPSVVVTDQFGNPVSGVSVTFAVASGGGSATGTSATTNASGIATVGSWKLGTAAGANTLTAASSGLTTVTFNAAAVAGSAGSMAANGGDNQSATVNTNVAAAPSVLVTDVHGNPVQGVSVTFAVASGGGSGTGLARITNASGIATVGSWKLGTTAGANTLSASATGLPSVTFNATGTAAAAAALAVHTGDNQSATVNANVATAPSVRATDTYGNPVSGVNVTFAAASGGGSATGLSQSTNASGVATVGNWKLGTGAGENTLTAAAAGLTTVTFHATGTADSLDHLMLSPASATVAAGTTQTYTAQGRDSYGNSLGDVTGSTTFTVAGGTCVAADCSSTTAGSHLVTGTFAAASGSAMLTVTPGAATTLAASSGDNQTVTVNTTVTPPSALVTDAYGNPVPNFNVTFAVASGGGSATATSATTNASGIATVGSWTLGTASGANTLTAAGSGLSTVAFHATGVADVATTTAIAGGNNQTATVATDVSAPPTVRVTDSHGNPVQGVSVTFAVASGGGSGTGLAQTTAADGTATMGSWTLGNAAGANTVTATSAGLSGSPLTFHATGLAGGTGGLAIGDGDNESATVNANVATAPTVRALDSLGNPVSGVSVTFAVASGNGSVTGAVQTTDADGVATVGGWKLGTTAGNNTLSATATGFTSVTFAATGTPGAPSAMSVSSGEGQSATVDTSTATAPAVSVNDSFGNGISGVAVTFTVTGGGGTAGGTSVTTNASGVAAVGNWKLGTVAGANTLTASATGLATVMFHATGTAAAASGIAVNAGDGQSATVNTNVGSAPSVKVTDQFGNAVANVSVTFTVASGGGSALGLVQSTNGSGVATVGSWKLGTTAGANTLAATSGSLTGSPVTFTATGTADSAATIGLDNGDGQNATVNTNVPTAPSVKISDQYGNAVSGVSVTFALGSGGGSLTGGNATTNASGVAAVGSWKLGSAAGANTLTATSGSLAGSPVTFTATGTAGTVDHLILSPASVTITADDSQTYTVEGRDQFNNPAGDVTGATTLSVTGGTCLGAVCSAPTTGAHTVTGSFFGALGNATLNVSSGAPTHLAFTAGGTGDLALGATRSFTVAIEDAQNNIVTSDNATSVNFARTAGPGNLTGLGAATVSAGSASKTVTASVEGQVTLTASATGLTSASQTFTVDPAPVATIDNGPADPSTSSNATFDYSANDGAATFECSVDAAAYAPCPGTGSGSESYTLATSDVPHTFDVRAKSASATGPAAHAAWMVDTTTPTVSLTQPADGSYVNTPTKTLAASASDTGTGVGAVDFEFSSTPGADCSTGTWTLINSDTTSTYDATWTTPADGSYALRAVAHDGATHSSCSLVHVTVDQTAPTATLVSPAANVRGSITLHASGVADATSGLNSVSFERAPSGTSSWAFVGNGVAQGGGAYDAAFDTDTPATPDGTYDFRISVTDVAGNLSQRVVGPIRVDNTAPTSTMGAVAPNVRQTITLGSTESDAGSGVASTGFQISPAGAGTWTTVPASFDTTTKTDGDYDLRSVATDNVGNVGYSTPVTTKIDNTPPAATLDAIARYVRGSMTLGSSTNDAGSGLATVRYELSAQSANSWSTITSPFDTATQADGDYDFRVVAIDNAGNRTDSATQLVTIDNTAPTAQLDDPASSSIKHGTITLASTVSDATSGVATTTYRVAPVGTPEASPCDSWGTAAAATFDTKSVADGLYDFRVIAIDNSGNGRCSAINTSVRIDNTAPVTTDNAPSGPRNSDVTVNLSPSDGGSGVVSTVYRVDSGPNQSGTSVVIPAANQGTHVITYHSTDAAGNVEPDHTAQVVIDTTAPTGGAGNGGNAVRGNYVLTDSPTAPIASVEFQYSTGASGPWTSIGTDTDGSNGWHVTWDTTSVGDGTYHLQMIEADDANNTTTTPLADTVVDNTAPASASVNVTGCGAECSGTVTLTGSADASVSGIGAMVFEIKEHGAADFTPVATQTSGFSFNWSSTSVTDGLVDIRVAVTDKAGNGPTESPVTTVTVDNNVPTVTLTAPSNVSGTVALGASGSADIASVAYAISASGANVWTPLGTANGPSPYTFSWASGGRADGAYDLRVTATDGGGNQGSNIKAITIDNTGPTGALTQPAAGATVGGPSVAFASTSSDGGTGVASVTYQFRPTGPGTFTDIAGNTWDATGVASGDYDLRARITDNAGNVTFTAVHTVTVDSTPPSLSLASLGTLLSGNLTIDAAVTGASHATLQVSPTGANNWTTVGSSSAAPFQITFDSSSLTDGVYDVRVIAIDAFGNQASDTRNGITFDNTAPQLTASTPEDGGVLPNGSTISALSLTASEPLQSVTNVKVDGQPVLAAPVVTGATVNVPLDAPVADGLHTFTGKLTDAAGKISSFRINTTILAPPGSLTQPPIVSKNARPNSQTILTSADNSATVFVPAGAYDVPFGHEDDFLVLSMGPQVASIAPMSGMTMTGSIVDVTMDWNSNGESLHQFRIPLAITMSDPTGGVAIPATYQNGQWRLIPMIQSPVLPAGEQDGFYRDATGVHVLTKHLTLFTLVRDVQLPAAPRDFAAVVGPDGLTLRWAPGIDGNRIHHFVLYVDGQPYRYFGPTEFETKLGAFTADDTRSFAVAEVNTSGISSAPTTPLQAVPTVTGRTVADATATLAARGFTVGKLVPVVSSEPVGTVVGPTGVQLLPAGSIVDLQVSSSSVPRQAQFVFQIAMQKRVRLTNRTLAVHVLATAPAKISVTLDGANYRRIQRWSFPATPGPSVHTLKLAQTLKPGTYTLYWLGRTAGGGTFRTTRKIRLITEKAKAHMANPAQIVLTVSETATSAKRAVQSAGETIEATPEQSFAVASSRDASVVIVDADKYGVQLVRDLHTVFPTTSIVALSKSKVTLAIVARPGVYALPSSTSARELAALVDKLSKK